MCTGMEEMDGYLAISMLKAGSEDKSGLAASMLVLLHGLAHRFQG